MKPTHSSIPAGTVVESTHGLKSLGAVIAERWRKARPMPVQIGSPSIWFHNGQPA